MSIATVKYDMKPTWEAFCSGADWINAPPKSGRHNMKIKVNKHGNLGSKGFGLSKQFKALAISSWCEAI